MALPLKYNIRNVLVRWRSTVFTVVGLALVVAVYVGVQSMAAGLEGTSTNTGDPRNVLVVRKGSTAESSSQVTREQFRLMQYREEIARDAGGEPLVSADLVVLISLPRVDGRGEANVLVRGVSPAGKELRPQVRLRSGEWFTPGRRQVVVSERLARRFANLGIGESFRTAGVTLGVTGVFEARNSAFDSEIWMDADEARSVFDRDMYSSVLMRAASPDAATRFIAWVESDKRMAMRAQGETDYYAEQTLSAAPFRILGNLLAVAMFVGAVFAAMNTMYASVGARTREVGTLRVLGYRRRTILVSFLIEGAFLALIGGALGCLLALPMNGYSTGAFGLNTFSEVVYQFRVTPVLILKGMVFSVVMGLVGSLLPAYRASQLPVIAALKSV